MKIRILFIFLSLVSFNCKKESNSSGIDTKSNTYTVVINGIILNSNHIGLDSVIISLQKPLRFDTSQNNGSFSCTFQVDGVNEINTQIVYKRQYYYDTTLNVKYSPTLNIISLPEVIMRSVMDTINESSNVIMPFNIGNTWTYKTTSFAFNGDIVSYGTTTISIESDTIINGIKWYVMKSDIFYFYTGSIYRNDSAGMYKSSLSGSGIFMYPFPSQPGFDNPQSGLKVISIDTTYYSPIGSYNCYLYSIRQLEAVLYNYYSPNIGPIHLEESSSTIHGTRYVSRKMDLINVVLK